MASNEDGSQLTESCWEFCGLSEDELSSFDVAALNLAVARGLPGVDAVDVVACLAKLDEWANRVRLETLRQAYRFDPRSQQPVTEFHYGNSLGRFCCYILLQVLQQDCGVVYNPKRKFDPDFGDPSDLFVHGILDKKGGGGTCATMPVVYVAVARRLGYPVRLVETREHLFFRWEDLRGTFVRWNSPATEFWIPPERFNVEGAGEGIAYYPDSFYIQWPHFWKETDFAHGAYLRSLTRKEEFASFMVERGECFWEYGNWNEALKAYHFARKLAPNDQRYEWLHAKRTYEYEQQLAEERQRILEINERNRRASTVSMGVLLPTGPRILKIAFGTPYPINLPPGTTVQYVRAEEADPVLPVGRPLRVAAGQPLPTNLPAGMAVQVVPPEFADRIPNNLARNSYLQDANLRPGYLPDPYLEQVNRIKANNARLLAQHDATRSIRNT